MVCEDLRERYLAPGRIRALRMRVHRGLPARLIKGGEQIGSRAAARQVLLRKMEVARRGAQAAVPHQALDRVHIGARFEQWVANAWRSP